MGSISRFFREHHGDRRWDLLLRATALVSLAGIPLVLFVPRSAVLVGLAVLSLPVNSPLSPVIPAAFEPLIMEAAKYEPALAVTLVALAVYMYTEYLNYHFYRWVLSWERLLALRGNRVVRWGVERFSRAPFSTVFVFALTPLPFWVARCLAILHRYPLPRFMTATAVGRFPRILGYAWLGAQLRLPGLMLLAVVVGSAIIVVAGRLARGQRLLEEPLLTAGDGPTPPPPSPSPGGAEP